MRGRATELHLPCACHVQNQRAQEEEEEEEATASVGCQKYAQVLLKQRGKCRCRLLTRCSTSATGRDPRNTDSGLHRVKENCQV
mmetsp:Transcript_53487/g.106437  ORF Transcript_53487/g.106437 Transcript_53487/m.106437 type:complete len:84 (-) Transcript_53487:2820-3071(-)